MSHFAKLDDNDVVMEVLVIEQDMIDTGRWGDPASFVQTSYNNNIRVRFAGIGFSYDRARDAFIPPKPFPSWLFDETTLNWKPPTPEPTTGLWDWDEQSQSWQQVTK